MNKNIETRIAPSILSADFTKLGQEIDDMKSVGIEWIYVDVMDGSFVPNITFGDKIASTVRQWEDMVVDTHLMVVNPEKHIAKFAKAGSDYISIHSEAATHLHYSIKMIMDEGVKPGVSIVPTTPISDIELILEYVDMVLIMSVDPGFGGQKLIPFSYKKIAELNDLRNKYDLDFKISVDGGVNGENGKKLIELGADILIMGSAYFATPVKDRPKLVKSLQRDPV